jgi:MFS-type transporter involved in bile tolerance (Atg22 family)
MGPVAFQYGAEIAYPVPEGTSFGILMLMGQISGIIFIYIMDALRIGKAGDMTVSLIGFIVLLIISFLIAIRLKESSIINSVEGVNYHE